ncbi:hypothetical protein T190_06010 [Sinorhizobium meliloti CCBAU 01290]|nr:hypothetical protein T190_06010 [Sinorhizobium meliloti CCBAU 01290]
MSDSQLGTHLDVGRRFGPEGEWGVRFNGAYRGDDTRLEHSENEVGVASLGLDYRGDRVRASLDLNQSKQDIARPHRCSMALFRASKSRLHLTEKSTPPTPSNITTAHIA